MMIAPIRSKPVKNFYLTIKKLLEIASSKLVDYICEIPVRGGVGDYFFSVTLDEVPLVFRFKWNGRLSRWSLTISDENDNIIIAGRLVVNGIDLLGQYNDPRLPSGKLFAVSVDDTNRSDAKYDDFGKRVKLYYHSRRVA